MSQISTQNEDNLSAAASDFVQALETKFAQMLSTQSEQHQQEMAQLKDGFAKEMSQLESKNRKLEEKLMIIEKQMMAQFQAQFHSLEQKLEEAEQRAQIMKNELEEVIQANQLKMEKFREEMDKNVQQVIGSNLNKLDYMWSQLIIPKIKILANPKGIVWDESKTEASTSISECGLKATFGEWDFAIATEGYAIPGEHCRKENFQFPGSIVSYYEVTAITSNCFWNSSIGFTDGSKNAAGFDCVGGSPNSYGIAGYDAKFDYLWLSGKKRELECPTGVIGKGDVLGCGLLLNSKNELAVFFTLNGILLVKQTRINPTVDRLFPTVSIYYGCVEANFGDNLAAKPFKFDTDKCPGLVFD